MSTVRTNEFGGPMRVNWERWAAASGYVVVLFGVAGAAFERHDAADVARPQAAGRSTRRGVRRRFSACRIETHAAFSTDARHNHGSFIEGVMPAHDTASKIVEMVGGWRGPVVVGGQWNSQ